MGQKYAQGDANGNITGLFDDAVNSAAQIGTATKITDAQWQDIIANQGKWLLVSGALQLAPTPTAAQLLVQAQNSANSAIDAQAGTTRAKYITTVPGQSETYMSKATDAAAYKAAGYPFSSLASYPWVQAEAVAINGATPTAAQAQAAADSILAAQMAWIAKGAQIEQSRRAGATAVAAATTVAAVQAAQASAVTALQAL